MRQRDAGCDMDLLSERSAGVLLHVSSLPGRYGMGTMGAEARAFIDFLAGAGFRCWQVLPLVQTGFGDSPYQSVYGASGNPCFIDPELLAEERSLAQAGTCGAARARRARRFRFCPRDAASDAEKGVFPL